MQSVQLGKLLSKERLKLKFMYKLFGILLLFLIGLSVEATTGESYRFRVYLKDKGDAGYRLDQPETYLSKEAVDRRARQRIPLTETDLPIAPAYLDTLIAAGVQPVVQSKWLATVVVATTDSLAALRLEQLSIVDSVKWVWKGDGDAFCVSSGPNPVLAATATKAGTAESGISADRDTSRLIPADQPLKEKYGYAKAQIQMLNGIRLHEAGFRGEGIRVAVIDAGFEHVDRMSVFDSLKLLGTHNVVFPGGSVFEGDDHGTKVMSCLAANTPGIMIGTAPEASYWLIKSEDNRSEFPIEEDYWTAAVEFADSVGVDVVTSSLGYFIFDVEALSHTPEELDGATAQISRAARIAASKGLLLFSSAGNEGSGQWGKITFPADAPDILTVGAVNEHRKKSSFSSTGFTADYRVKPDVVALGTGCCVVDPSGNIRYANGTSFSTPIVAGLGICLWQALPCLSNKELIERMQQSASRHKRPDAELGYGLPDFYKIYKREQKDGQQSDN